MKQCAEQSPGFWAVFPNNVGRPAAISQQKSLTLGTKYTTVHIATNILAKVVEAETETVVQSEVGISVAGKTNPV